MQSVLLLLMALASLVITLRAFLQWWQGRSAMILFVLLPLAALPIELLAAGLGLWGNAGDPVKEVGRAALVWMQITLPLSLFSLATLCRRVGFAWAKIDWGHGGVCILAFLMLFYELPAALRPDTRSAPVSVVGWLVFAMFLACGLGLWRARRWPWLLAGMVSGMLLLLLSAGPTGPFPLYLGKLLIFSAMAVTMMHFAHLFPVVRAESGG